MDPKFVKFPGCVNIDEGSPVNIDFQVTGSQPITIKWFKDNKELAESDRVKLVSDNAKGVYSLSIPTALSIDDGQYHVAASNQNGEAIAAFSLIVSFDANHPSGNIDINKILQSN